MLRAITLDYWDTLYIGAPAPERGERRRQALFQRVTDLGATCTLDEFLSVYRNSAAEFDLVWRSGRGYRTEDRLAWIFDKLGIASSAGPDHLRDAARIVDEAIVELSPPLLPGAAQALAALRGRFQLGIISDTGFASGDAQNRVLAKDGLLPYFAATVYSNDVGHAKPSPQIFQTARDALGIEPHEVLHVGDNERTDVGGAIAAGWRAVRLDAVRDGGPSRAEHVALSLEALTRYLLNGDGR